jgi:hypothetical protein
MKGASYSGKDGKKNVLGDIARAKAEYGKYYSPTEFLLATGKKGGQGWSGTTSALGSSGMSNGGNITYEIKIENNNNAKISGREIIDAIKQEARRRGKSSGVWNLGTL